LQREKGESLLSPLILAFSSSFMFGLKRILLLNIVCGVMGCSHELPTVQVLQSPPSPSPVAARTASLLRGIDVSHYNGDLVQEVDSSDQLSFMIIKATEGVSLVDPRFTTNWKTAGEKRMIRGAYHFYRADEDPVQQVEHFLSTISEVGTLEIAPIVDVEQGSLPGGVTVNREELQTDLLIFLQTLKSRTNRAPILYTGRAFGNNYLNDSRLGGYRLWLAEYTSNPEPVLPLAWRSSGYMMWQKSETYSVHSKPTDYDIFRGSREELLS